MIPESCEKENQGVSRFKVLTFAQLLLYGGRDPESMPNITFLPSFLSHALPSRQKSQSLGLVGNRVEDTAHIMAGVWLRWATPGSSHLPVPVRKTRQSSTPVLIYI